MISFQEIQTAINIYGHYIATAAAVAVAAAVAAVLALRNHYLRFNRQKDTFFAHLFHPKLVWFYIKLLQQR